MIRRLNAKEEQVMNILWGLKDAFVQDIINEFHAPQPHYNTISSIVRKLEKEGYIDHKAVGRSHKYFPIASKKAYKAALFEHLFSNYFDGSNKKFLTYVKKRLYVKKAELKSLLKKSK
jgi:predicted transcriptional regulator